MKNLIRKIAQKYNYDIVKLNEFSQKKASEIVYVKVGKFIVKMPGNNPQISNYKKIPDMNFQLGRLSKLASDKYNNISIIDVGANVGDTIAIIKNYTNAQVIGIEGDDASYKFLESNVKQFENIILIKEFLSEENKSIKANLEKGGWNGTIIPNNEGNVDISFKTLDKTLQDLNLFNKNIKVLKTDVEGFDTIVLRGATEIIKQHNPILFFEYNRPNMKVINENGFSTLLSFKNYGYDKIVFFDNKGRFLLSTDLDNEEQLTQLHNYADGSNGMIGYFDIGLFHQSDFDIYSNFIKGETMINNSN